MGDGFGPGIHAEGEALELGFPDVVDGMVPAKEDDLLSRLNQHAHKLRNKGCHGESGGKPQFVVEFLGSAEFVEAATSRLEKGLCQFRTTLGDFFQFFMVGRDGLQHVAAWG